MARLWVNFPMKMTTKGRYAVTAMLDLALQSDGSPTPLADVAERQGLSLSYLEQLFAQLRKAGLVQSTRGPGGGYALRHAPPDIAVGAVIKAVDREQAPVNRGEPCYLSQMWDELSQEIETFLNSVTLADILRGQEVKSVAARQQRVFVERNKRADSQLAL